MFTPCITCAGRGATVVMRRSLSGSAPVLETCRTCLGARGYNWLTGPGVDHARTHGSGLE